MSLGERTDPRVERLRRTASGVEVSLTLLRLRALRRADQALYEAKRQGRSRAVVATGGEEQPVFSESRPLGLGALSSVNPWSPAQALSA